MTKEIPLTQGKVAIVDDEDYDYLNQFKWWCKVGRNTYYAKTHITKKIQKSMHYLILKPPVGKLCDHIDGNGLNNRRSNLRCVSNRENLQNLHIIETSQFPGVYWHKKDRKWQTKIQVGATFKYLGNYSDEETAGIVYAMACNALKMGCVL
jgi:hypothetical protein